MKARVLCLITSPSARGDEIINQLLNEVSYADESFFSVMMNGLDVSQGTVRELNLICYDINTHFDTLFQNYSLTTYTSPNNTKRALNKAEGVIIFSKNSQEIETICNEIKKLSKENRQPLIMIVCSQEHVNNGQEKIIPYPQIVVPTDALAFWQKVRKQLDTEYQVEENNVFNCSLQ